MRPLWVEDVLVLARKVTVDGDSFYQGLWLNWESIREELLGEIRDLLPDARLVSVRDLDAGVPSRMLAALPVELQPGEPAIRSATASSPLSAPLLIAWLCVVAAAGAVGLVLIGAVTLSERRAAFVSAVTHELRTPLTTFQMYAEMLEQGMVGDPDRQREYLATLRAEGSRLSHLVENVLSFSRIERGNAGGHPEDTTLADLVETMRDRLTTRAEQAQMQLIVSGDPGAATEVHVDRSMTEQILYNLVDNACKYAAKADDRRIHIEMENGNRRGIIRVLDHGPGIAASEARRLFRPFHKSAKNAAESAPGVGLGLALSRRLAHQMKGELRIEASVNGGACFELILPAKLAE
jgi:signal transduction histidine kinase